jgi:hypothetical protein
MSLTKVQKDLIGDVLSVARPGVRWFGKNDCWKADDGTEYRYAVELSKEEVFFHLGRVLMKETKKVVFLVSEKSRLQLPEQAEILSIESLFREALNIANTSAPAA